jgi:hypothetical protein
MKQLVNEINDLVISTVKLGAELDYLDDLLGLNPEHLPYETMVFHLIKAGEPNFSSPIETKRYATQTEAEVGHQIMVKKYDPINPRYEDN